jgi:isopentenyldiphosphate isomerase
MNKINVVNEKDQIIGSAELLDAKEQGVICQMSIVLVFNDKNQLLLQKRSKHVTNALLWDSSAGGHVDEGEDYAAAAKRELFEEICITPQELVKLYYITERAQTKHAFYTIYATRHNGPFKVDPLEVDNVQWFSKKDLDDLMANHPQEVKSFLAWLYQKYLKNSYDQIIKLI